MADRPGTIENTWRYVYELCTWFLAKSLANPRTLVFLFLTTFVTIYFSLLLFSFFVLFFYLAHLFSSLGSPDCEPLKGYLHCQKRYFRNLHLHNSLLL